MKPKTYNLIPKTSQRGFTLVELLLYMSLLSVLLIVLTDIFASALSLQRETESFSAVEQDGRFIISRLQYDIGQASAIVSPSTLGTPANSLQITVNGISYTYSLNNGNVQLVNNNGTDVLNSYDATASAFTVTRLGNSLGKNSIQVNFTMVGRTKPESGPQTRSFQTIIGTR